jgi:hypothetical protein
MPKKLSISKRAEVHKDLQGFNIKIDTFGEMKSTLSIDQINQFLDKHLPVNLEKSNEVDEEE